MHQVCAVLMQVTEGEANDIVCNSSGMGLEAWRKLTRRWNPLTGSRLRNLLRHVISPGRASLTELPGALERWEEQVSKYRNSKNQQGQSRDIPEDILMAALESLVPTDLDVHLQMNSSRFETYDAMRVEVLAFIDSRTGSRMTETKVHKHDKIRDDPMDLGFCGQRQRQEQVLRLLLHLWQGRPQGHRVLVKRQSFKQRFG